MSDTQCSGADKAKDLMENQKPDSAEKPNNGATKPWKPIDGNFRVRPGEHTPKSNPGDTSDVEIPCEQYNKVSPAVRSDGDTKHAYLGMPNGHAEKGSPTSNNKDSNNVPITGGLGYGLVSWPPKRKPNPFEYQYTAGDEWQQAVDTCAAQRRCGNASDNQNSDSGAGHSNTQSQINSKFNY